MSATGLLMTLSVLPVTLFIGIAIYIMYSMGLYQMARNTGVMPASFAWLPLLRLYTLGQIADRYNSSIGKRSSYRFLLPLLRFLEWILLLLCIGSLLIGVSIVGTVGMSIVMLIVCGILQLLVRLMELLAYYKVFCDFEPEYSVLYLILAVLGLEWLPVFLCRNNMPVGVVGHQFPRQPRYNEL